MITSTKFGNGHHGALGYIQITTGPNKGKLLHRLIWEEWYGKPVPNGYDIHHLNGNKSDNRIQNLQCVEHLAHMKSHNKGRTFSEETRKKLSESKTGEKNHNYGKHLSEETKRNISKSKNTTGFLFVTKDKSRSCKQGFFWKYQYRDANGKQKSIVSVDIKKLEQKVKAQGLPWGVFQ